MFYYLVWSIQQLDFILNLEFYLNFYSVNEFAAISKTKTSTYRPRPCLHHIHLLLRPYLHLSVRDCLLFCSCHMHHRAGPYHCSSGQS